jgi:hypothetical protein
MTTILSLIILFSQVQHPPVDRFRHTAPTIRPVVEVWL